MQAFAIAVLALGAANAVLLAVLIWRRVRLGERARRRAELERQLRPAVLAFLEGEGELPATAGVREQEVLADLLGGYARKLRGPALTRIAHTFNELGTVDRETRAMAGARKPWRRAAAAHRLGDIGSSWLEPALVAALADPDRGVRSAAARSLGKLGGAGAVEPLLAAAAVGAVPQALVGWALLSIGPPALPALRRLLVSENDLERAGAVRMIGLLGDASDGEAVAARLRDTSAGVRAAAAQALERLGGPRDFDAVLAALEDRVPAVRRAAADALGRLRDRRALEPLLRCAETDLFDVAQAAARAAAAIDLEAASSAAAAGARPHLAEAVDLAGLA
jgi:hypothetical protein